MNLIQVEVRLMGSESGAVNFLEYSEALARQRRRAALLRAEMIGASGQGSGACDEQEGHDREILSRWEDTYGHAGFAF